MVRHLTWVERLWFQWRLAGADVDLFLGPDNAGHVPAGAERHRRVRRRRLQGEIEEAQRIVAGVGSLDDVAAGRIRSSGS